MGISGDHPVGKYDLVTDSEQYCEGTVKRTPGGEVKENLKNLMLTSSIALIKAWYRTF